jgi:hypothetical protein
VRWSERDALLERSLPTCTEEEVTGYVWAVKPGTGGAGLKEQPLKENDHGLWMPCATSLLSGISAGDPS